MAKDKILEMATKYPVLLFTGPRQSGKTTLSKVLFPEHQYVNLENPDNREFAQSDPRGFLAIYKKVIIDEAQNVPELFSYIQQIVDDKNEPGQYILSGSQNFLLLEKITQSLAGRVYMQNYRKSKRLTCQPYCCKVVIPEFTTNKFRPMISFLLI
jgi:predicted AAA+ superfamily ATPase